MGVSGVAAEVILAGQSMPSGSQAEGCLFEVVCKWARRLLYEGGGMWPNNKCGWLVQWVNAVGLSL